MSSAGTLGARREPPEPGLTQDEMIARAVALRPRLVADQAATEERTYYSPEMHEAFLAAGFYHLYVPRRYGGYEFDVPTYVRVVQEIARGCVSTAWCVGLAINHALMVGSWWPQEAQDGAGTPGWRLHGNPMYSGRAISVFTISLAAVAVGAAYNALDEYERLMRERKTPLPPFILRIKDPDYQRWYGRALTHIATAEAATHKAAERHMEACRRNVEDGGRAGFHIHTAKTCCWAESRARRS